MGGEFYTDSLSLAPFLSMNGLKYLRAEPSIGKNDKSVVLFVFSDPEGIGLELSSEFFKSDFKVYRDMVFYYRNEIEKLKRKLNKLSATDKEQYDE